MFMVNLEHISYVENDSTNTGAGRATAIKADLENLQLGSSHIKEYYVSGCFDGQYILGDVENKLRESLQLPPEYDCHWDFAHFLETKHKKVLERSEWAQESLEFTNTVNREFSRSDKKTQLMFQQNSENIKNQSLKAHSKVTWFCMFCDKFFQSVKKISFMFATKIHVVFLCL